MSMRKAFDANVPKLKPRLKSGNGAAALPLEATEAGPSATEVLAEALAEGVAEAAESELAPPPPPPPATTTTAAIPAPSTAAISTPTPTAAPVPVAAPVAVAAPTPTAPAARSAELDDDVLARKERLDKIKRRVAEAARPQPRPHVVPADPGRAAESVLALVHDLEAELVRAREREEALRGDLDEARRELSRTAADGRAAAERLGGAERELEEKRAVLTELLGEMQALEEERDESVRRAQALAALDEERARLLEEMGRRADEEGRLRAEREAEVERLSEELRLAGVDGARLRAAVGELARERDQLANEVERARRERDDLGEAKRALEQVHAALAQARARLG